VKTNRKLTRSTVSHIWGKWLGNQLLQGMYFKKYWST